MEEERGRRGAARGRRWRWWLLLVMSKEALRKENDNAMELGLAMADAAHAAHENDEGESRGE